MESFDAAFYLKLAGAALCAGGIIAFTLSMTGRMRRRVRSINAFLSALGVMRSEISSYRSDLYDVFALLAQTAPEPAAGFFASLQGQGHSPGEAMRAGLKKGRDDMCLEREEYSVLTDFAACLGAYDVDSQLTDIGRATSRLEEIRVRAEADCSGRARLYGTVGVSGALILVLILI